MAFSVSFVFKATDKYSKVLDKIAVATKKLRKEMERLDKVAAKQSEALHKLDASGARLLTRMRSSAKATGTYTASMKQATQATKAQAAAMKSISQLGFKVPRVAAPRLPAALKPGKPFTFSGMTEYKAMGKQLNNLKSSMSSVGHESNMLVQRLAALSVAGVGLFSAFVGPAAEMESLKARLGILYGTAKKGQEMFSFVQKFALKSPYSMDVVGDSLATLKNFGMGDQKQYENIMNYMSTHVPSGARAKGAIMQIGQAWSKGKLQAGDMRPMIENGVNVTDVLARALHKTTGEIAAMSHAGTIGRKEMMLLFQQFGKEAVQPTGVRKIDELWSTVVSNMGDTWKKFASNVMETRISGGGTVFSNMKSDILAFTEAMRNGIANGAVQRTANILNEIYQFAKGIVVFALKSLPVITGIFATISNCVGGVKNMLVLLMGIMTLPLIGSIINFTVQLIKSILTIRKWVIAIQESEIAMGALAVAMDICSGPVGWIALAVTAAGAAAIYAYNTWKPFTDLVDGAGAIISGLADYLGNWLVLGFNKASEACKSFGVDLRSVLNTIPGVGGMLAIGDFINANGSNMGNWGKSMGESMHRQSQLDRGNWYGDWAGSNLVKPAQVPIPGIGNAKPTAQQFGLQIELKAPAGFGMSTKTDSKGLKVKTGTQMKTSPAF